MSRLDFDKDHCGMDLIQTRLQTKKVTQAIRGGKKKPGTKIDNSDMTKNKCPSRWFLPTDIKVLALLVEPGDILEFDHRTISHWAVCFSVQNTKVYVSDLERKNYSNRLHKVVGNSRVRVNNCIVSLYKSIETDTGSMKERASTFLMLPLDDISKGSCLHFSIYCRFGVKHEQQPSILRTVAKTVHPSSVVSVAIASGVSGFWMGGVWPAAVGLVLGGIVSLGYEAFPAVLNRLMGHHNQQDICFHVRQQFKSTQKDKGRTFEMGRARHCCRWLDEFCRRCTHLDEFCLRCRCLDEFCHHCGHFDEFHHHCGRLDEFRRRCKRLDEFCHRGRRLDEFCRGCRCLDAFCHHCRYFDEFRVFPYLVKIPEK